MTNFEHYFKIATLNLFKAFPISNTKKENVLENAHIELLKLGIYLDGEATITKEDYKIITEVFGVSLQSFNNSFFKSFHTTLDTPDGERILYQFMHYLSVYCQNTKDIDNDAVFIPDTEIKIPEGREKFTKPFIILQTINKKDLVSRYFDFVKQDMAFSPAVIEYITHIFKYFKQTYKESFIEEVTDTLHYIKNKEIHALFSVFLNFPPKNSEEFLRCMIYLVNQTTVLIQSNDLIKNIKFSLMISRTKEESAKFLNAYIKKYGYETLASSFLRYKKLWLAFKTSQTSTVINKLRKMADTYHKPLKPKALDVINNIEQYNYTLDDVKEQLENVTLSKKVSILNSLLYRKSHPSSMMYRIRNGKGFVKQVNDINEGDPIVCVELIKNITKELTKKVQGKTFLIPKNVEYGFPISEKQYIGYLPFGTRIKLGKEGAIIGVHWNNIKSCSVDLDLHALDVKTKQQYGWNSIWHGSDDAIIFTGDMTNAPEPLGATETYHINSQVKDKQIMFVLNKYNAPDGKIPYKIFISPSDDKRIDQEYILDNSNDITFTSSEMKGAEDMLGVLNIDANGEKYFYIFNYQQSNSRVAQLNNLNELALDYLMNSTETSLSLNKALELGKAKIIHSMDEAKDGEKVIDLSLETLDKTTLMYIIKDL